MCGGRDWLENQRVAASPGGDIFIRQFAAIRRSARCRCALDPIQFSRNRIGKGESALRVASTMLTGRKHLHTRYNRPHSNVR